MPRRRVEPYALLRSQGHAHPVHGDARRDRGTAAAGSGVARRLTRTAYNLTAFSPTAEEICDVVTRAFPRADVTWETDVKRQRIVDSWPADVDDTAARRDWGFRAALRLRAGVRRLPDTDDQGEVPRMRKLSVAVVAAAATTLRMRAGHDMNTLGERYVRLVLAMGQHDADYVDAYYGPAEWRKEADAQKLPLDEITARAAALANDIAAAAPPATADELTRLRHDYLARQLEALRARAAMLAGTRLSFDEESKALYDAVAPTHTEAEFASVLAALEAKLPGQGPLVDRYDEFRKQFIIPRGSARCRLQGSDRRAAAAGRCSTSRFQPARASRWNTSPARAGAATTGTRGTIAA